MFARKKDTFVLRFSMYSI